jgi:hypothetical protein
VPDHFKTSGIEKDRKEAYKPVRNVIRGDFVCVTLTAGSWEWDFGACALRTPAIWSYKLSLHRITNIIQNMTENILFVKLGNDMNTRAVKTRLIYS